MAFGLVPFDPLARRRSVLGHGLGGLRARVEPTGAEKTRHHGILHRRHPTAGGARHHPFVRQPVQQVDGRGSAVGEARWISRAGGGVGERRQKTAAAIFLTDAAGS